MKNKFDKEKIFSLIIVNSFFIFLIFSVGGIGGKEVYGREFCSERVSHLTNTTINNYWMINHEEPFNHACCVEVGRGYYERDIGTIERFFLGAEGSYMKDSCEWISDEQQNAYNPPNKIVGTFKFIWYWLRK